MLLFNHSDKDFEIKEGDRIAQLVLERIYTPEVVEVQELEESVRGAEDLAVRAECMVWGGGIP